VRRLLERLALVRGVARGLRDPAGPDPDRALGEIDPRERRMPDDPRAALVVGALLAAGGLLAAAFAVLVVVHPQTQLLGGLLAAGLACFGIALGVASRRVVVQETSVEERHPPSPEEDVKLVDELKRGVEGITRRRVLIGGAAVAGCGLAAAAALPVTALGPRLGNQPDETPWRRGTRLVDPRSGEPISADELAVGSFQAAVAEGASLRELGDPVVVVRVEPRELRLAPERRAWAPEGLLAFSQICTHAACAVTLFRYPVDEQTSNGPALVCPCHYSTFDVTRGAKPVFGPAVRALPQLPLAIARDRTLVAAGPLSGSVGPSYWDAKPS
jgi:ubiquinol-cytochrome c reductase iron-sulfur subunit